MTPLEAIHSAEAVIAAGVRAPALAAGTPLETLDPPDHAWSARTERFLAAHIRWASQRLAVLSAGDESAGERAVLEACARHYEQARIGQQTVEQLAARWARNFLLTLRRDPEWATTRADPWERLPVFIVAAGPSLDRNGDLLVEAARRGPIVAVNTSVAACLHHGVAPAMAVCCEAKDLRDHLAPLQGTGVPVALSACASAENWAACDRAWGFIGHEPALVPYALQLGLAPVPFGGSVACAAVSLAMMRGADEIVLVGQDLAYTGGRLYAQGTPFADLRAEVRDGLVHVTGESKRMHPAPVVWRPGWGGGEPVPSVREMDGFAAWMAKAARVMRVTNATEGGARIPGTIEETLEQVLARREPARVWRRPSDPGYSWPNRTGDVLLGLAQDARACLASDACIPPPGLSLLHMYCVPVVLGWRGGLSLRERKAAMRDAIERGCREILEVIG